MVLGLPVVRGRIRGAFLSDIDQLHDGRECFSVRSLKRNRIRLDIEYPVVELFCFFLVASGAACQRARTVDAFPISVPDAVAFVVHADAAVVVQFDYPALDRINDPRQIVSPRHLFKM